MEENRTFQSRGNKVMGSLEPDGRLKFLSAKEDFLATLAHRLRNSLAPIRHAVKLMESERVGGAAAALGAGGNFTSSPADGAVAR